MQIFIIASIVARILPIFRKIRLQDCSTTSLKLAAALDFVAIALES